MQIAAVMAIIASFFPVVEGAIGSIPAVVIGGVSFILYGMISAIGVRNMAENKADLTKTRNLVKSRPRSSFQASALSSSAAS